MTRVSAIVAAILTIGLVGAGVALTILKTPGDKYAACRTARIAGGDGTIGGPFTLVSETGETVTDADVITGPTLLYFGYTYCPDVCPLDNARNAEAVTLLEERGYDVTPVFISIDPERDTPELLREFTDYLHPRMIGLTGSMDQVKAASRAYKTYFRKQDSDDPDYYLIDHSTFTYLVFPQEGFVEFFHRELTPEQLADRTACFIDTASQS